MELLTVKQVAELKNCSEQYIRKAIADRKIVAEKAKHQHGPYQHRIPLEQLEPKLQVKWYRQQGREVPEALRKAKREAAPVAKEKPLELFTAAQREEIAEWVRILGDWQTARTMAPSKAEGDRAFLAGAPERYGRRLTMDMLYRHWNAYRAKDWDGLVDKRGQHRRGKSDYPKEIRQLFESIYLDDHALSIAKCIEATEIVVRRDLPELAGRLPSYDTYWRWTKELSKPLETLARKGPDAFDDLWMPTTDRDYDELEPNDLWVADGHRIDVVTRSEDGSERHHRLTISAITDACSGMYVGWTIVDNPCSEATLYALRKAILRQNCVPRALLVDNGREYLTTDLGGLGHRQRKKKVEIKLPTPILQRLGIRMINALPANGRAKPIEREFRNFTFLSQLFDTYCGSSVTTKPEKLKRMLKEGKVPTDGELYRVVEDMIEGYFNQRPYHGKRVEDRGKTKMQVYQEHLHTARRPVDMETLNLMLMRSTRLQTVGKNGVYITIRGVKVYYSSDELVLQQAGHKVFVRYDPEDMEEVRIYDENEAFLMTAKMSREMMGGFMDDKEEIGKKAARQRRFLRLVKQTNEAQKEVILSRHGQIKLLDLFVEQARENRRGQLVLPEPKIVELMTSPELQPLAATGTDPDVRPVEVDVVRMIQNNERRQQG